MSKKVVFLFPGQGAQYVGMGRDFFDQFPIARQTFLEADEILGTNFSSLIFNGPAETLTETKNSQLAIYITSIAILRTFQHQFPDCVPFACAGLSLGEYTALTAASKITFKEGLLLVKARGEYMQQACISHPGTLRVVLGMGEEEVRKALPTDQNVWVANLNCPGQVVIAGTLEGIEKASQKLKESGAKRVLPLDVSGAFHSPLMREAQEKLAPKIAQTSLSSSPVAIVMNAKGDFVSSLEEMKTLMVNQVTHPVYWEKGIRALEAHGVDMYIELGCGKTLAGMNKKIGTTAPTLSIEKITDLESMTCNC